MKWSCLKNCIKATKKKIKKNKKPAQDQKHWHKTHLLTHKLIKNKHMDTSRWKNHSMINECRASSQFEYRQAAFAVEFLIHVLHSAERCCCRKRWCSVTLSCLSPHYEPWTSRSLMNEWCCMKQTNSSPVLWSETSKRMEVRVTNYWLIFDVLKQSF